MSRSRVTPEQLEKLLHFMEQHPEFAAGKPSGDAGSGQPSSQSTHARYSVGKLWRALAEKLNGCEGGASKSPDKWCRYWADIKYKSKKKTSAPGGCDNLSEVEERIKNIVGVGTKEYGTRRRSSIFEEDQKPSFNHEESLEAEPVDPIEQVNLSQAFGEPKLSTEELLAEAAMRSALAAEKQAEAVTQGVELLREFLSTFRQDMTTMQNIAHTILDRDQKRQV